MARNNQFSKLNKRFETLNWRAVSLLPLFSISKFDLSCLCQSHMTSDMLVGPTSADITSQPCNTFLEIHLEVYTEIILAVQDESHCIYRCIIKFQLKWSGSYHMIEHHDQNMINTILATMPFLCPVMFSVMVLNCMVAPAPFLTASSGPRNPTAGATFKI